MDLFAFPLAAALHGVGLLGGAGAGYKHFVAGHAVGRVEASAAGVAGLPVLGSRAALDAGVGVMHEGDLQTTYARGLAAGPVFRQVMKATGGGARLRGAAWRERVDWSLGLYTWFSEFEGYKTVRGDSIAIRTSDLKSFTTNVAAAAASIALVPERLRAEVSTSWVGGRVGQSDQVLLGAGLRARRPLGERFELRARTRLQGARVTRAQAPAVIDGRCGAIADAALGAQCADLETGLNRYIIDSNAHGTAAPLGGLAGPRGFRQWRFKAAHTAVSTLEAAARPLRSLELSLFWELAHADDAFKGLYAEGRAAYGAGLRWTLGPLELRVDAATGAEGESLFVLFAPGKKAPSR